MIAPVADKDSIDKAASQKAFETIARHLLAQKRQAMDRNGLCRYHAPDGLKCAVGAMIPVEKYRAEFEGKGVDYICNKLPDVFRGLGWPLLYALQGIHDDHSPQEWRGQLMALGTAYGLTWPEGL